MVESLDVGTVDGVRVRIMASTESSHSAVVPKATYQKSDYRIRSFLSLTPNQAVPTSKGLAIMLETRLYGNVTHGLLRRHHGNAR